MIRPIEDFMKASIDRGIRRWGIHNCGGCGYTCGYVIEGEAVLRPGPIPAQMADHYNRNQPENNPKISPAWVVETDSFWGFGNALIDGRDDG